MRRGRAAPPLSRGQRTTVVNAILVFAVLINLIQLWLLTATVHAHLSGDVSVEVPAALASGACFLLYVGLIWYLHRLER